jgi:hypothetical protein
MRVSVLEPAPNQALEPTPYSLRFASASGRGSPPALGVNTRMRTFTGTICERSTHNAIVKYVPR